MASEQPTLRHFPPGAIIFSEGEGGRLAYVVESGEVELLKTTSEGETTLGVIGPGALFGEMALLDGGPRAATARARGAVTVKEVERRALLGQLAAGPERAFQLLGRLANYARENARLAALADARAHSAPPSPVAGPILDDPADLESIWRAGPSRLMGRIAAVVIAVVAITAVAASVTVVDETVRARGRLNTTTANVIVQSGLDAKVLDVLIRRGDRVTAGQPVIALDGADARSTLAGLTARAEASRLKVERMRRELAALEAAAQGRAVDGLADGLDPTNAEALVRRVEEFRARLEAFDQSLALTRHRVETVERDAKLVSEQFDVKTRIEDARRGLHEAGNGPLLNLLTAKDDRLATQRELEGLREKAGDLRTEARSTAAERAAFIASWTSTLATDLAAEAERGAVASSERAKTERAVADATVRAPVDGYVLDLPSLERGSLVKAGQGVMTLVRADVPLAFEVDVPPKDVGALHLGQPVSIKLDAYPFQRHGDVKGVIALIGRDTVAESLEGDKGAFYRARIDFQPVGSGANGGDAGGLALIPGMRGWADMRVGERALITHLTDPILGVTATAFRDRR